jgi:hypothetical protein
MADREVRVPDREHATQQACDDDRRRLHEGTGAGEALLQLQGAFGGLPAQRDPDEPVTEPHEGNRAGHPAEVEPAAPHAPRRPAEHHRRGEQPEGEVARALVFFTGETVDHQQGHEGLDDDDLEDAGQVVAHASCLARQ